MVGILEMSSDGQEGVTVGGGPGEGLGGVDGGSPAGKRNPVMRHGLNGAFGAGEKESRGAGPDRSRGGFQMEETAAACGLKPPQTTRAALPAGAGIQVLEGGN